MARMFARACLCELVQQPLIDGATSPAEQTFAGNNSLSVPWQLALPSPGGAREYTVSGGACQPEPDPEGVLCADPSGLAALTPKAVMTRSLDLCGHSVDNWCASMTWPCQSALLGLPGGGMLTLGGTKGLGTLGMLTGEGRMQLIPEHSCLREWLDALLLRLVSRAPAWSARSAFTCC